MNGFKNSLIIRSSSKKDYKLPMTTSIVVIPKLFTIDPLGNYAFIGDKTIETYTTTPFNCVDKVEYKKEVKDILKASENLYILNDEAIISHSEDNFNEFYGDFANCKLVRIFMNTNKQAECIGIQSQKNLSIFDNKLNKLMTYRCQCSYSIKDITVLGDFNTLKIYVKDVHMADISMPDYITALVVDPMFSRIFCATQDNSIYSVSTSGEPIQKLEYYSSHVKKMHLNISGEYLYSSDGKMICVWNAIHNVVLGYVEFDNEIIDFDIFQEGDRKYDEIPVFIK